MTPTDLSAVNLPLYPASAVGVAGATFFLTRESDGPGAGKRLGVLAAPGADLPPGFDGEPGEAGGRFLLLCPLTHANAASLRAALPWLSPVPLGLATSAGCGDRLGIATPGHVQAAQKVNAAAGRAVAMIFAQQSIREMARTGRTPDEVMDDATWGAFQAGWRAAVGADADHLKTPEDIDNCAAAGFTFFTIDPGAHVDSAADTADEAMLREKYAALPWAQLEISPSVLAERYAGRRFELPDRALALDERTLYRAAAKYGRAVAHVTAMYRHLKAVMAERPCELEVSVDETDTPTTHAEHLFIAHELRRLGVHWVSLAPRYVGRFEKGVDYIGSLSDFDADFAGHAAIASAFGPYKLSLHSGSDKFSIYARAAAHARGLLHLKTAGTSYLEALRATAGFAPALFREIYAFAIARYETDRASYHVSASLARVPAPETLSDAELPGLLEQFDARQVLHVTFGSVLTSERGFKPRLFAGLAAHEEAHYAALERHFVRHLAPLVE
jgi:tagaturonate epimerase